jgi:hypothetical protein
MENTAGGGMYGADVSRETQRRNVDDVEAVVAILLQDHKVAAATHNIMAYRIAEPNGVWAQDHDDDGETAAGKNLLHLMQLVDVVNVVVVRSPRTGQPASKTVDVCLAWHNPSRFTQLLVLEHRRYSAVCKAWQCGKLLWLICCMQEPHPPRVGWATQVVTRWFGGIHLGPDRFKIINNVARSLLDHEGYIKQKKGSKSSSSSKAR